MIFPNTTPQTFEIYNGHTYVATVEGGNVAIERQLESGTWLAVDGSPLLDGEEKFVTTHSHPNAEGKALLRVTPTAADTEFTLDRA